MKLNLKIDVDTIDLEFQSEEAEITAQINMATIALYTAQLAGRIPSKAEIPNMSRKQAEQGEC